MQEAGVAAGAGRLQHEDLLHDVRIEGGTVSAPCDMYAGITDDTARELFHYDDILTVEFDTRIR